MPVESTIEAQLVTSQCRSSASQVHVLFHGVDGRGIPEGIALGASGKTASFISQRIMPRVAAIVVTPAQCGLIK